MSVFINFPQVTDLRSRPFHIERDSGTTALRNPFFSVVFTVQGQFFAPQNKVQCTTQRFFILYHCMLYRHKASRLAKNAQWRKTRHFVCWSAAQVPLFCPNVSEPKSWVIEADPKPDRWSFFFLSEPDVVNKSRTEVVLPQWHARLSLAFPDYRLQWSKSAKTNFTDPTRISFQHFCPSPLGPDTFCCLCLSSPNYMTQAYMTAACFYNTFWVSCTCQVGYSCQ